MSIPTPNPNEVMDVDRIHKLVKHQLRAARSTTKTVTALAKPIKAELERYVAQQNAALLRSLLERKRVTGQIGENGYRVDTEWIPASILEVKLNEITKEVI